jgi:hypothetical protein
LKLSTTWEGLGFLGSTLGRPLGTSTQLILEVSWPVESARLNHWRSVASVLEAQGVKKWWSVSLALQLLGWHESKLQIHPPVDLGSGPEKVQLIHH